MFCLNAASFPGGMACVHVNARRRIPHHMSSVSGRAIETETYTLMMHQGTCNSKLLRLVHMYPIVF